MKLFDKTRHEIFSGLSQYKFSEIEKQLNKDLSLDGELKGKSVSAILRNGGKVAEHLKAYLMNMRFQFSYVSEPKNQFDIFYGFVNDGVDLNEAWDICIKQSPSEYANVIKNSSYLTTLIGHEITDNEHRRNFLKCIMACISLPGDYSEPEFKNALKDIAIQSIFGVVNTDDTSLYNSAIDKELIKDICSIRFDERPRSKDELRNLEKSISSVYLAISPNLIKKIDSDVYSCLINMSIYNYAARMFLKKIPAELICRNLQDVVHTVVGLAHDNSMVAGVLVRQALVNVACALPVCLPFIKPTHNEIMGIIEDTPFHQGAAQSVYRKIMHGPMKNFMSSQIRLERIAQFTEYMKHHDYAINFENAINSPLGKTMIIADLLDLQGGESSILIELIEKREIDPEILSKVISRLDPVNITDPGFCSMWASLLNYYQAQAPSTTKEIQKLKRTKQSAVHLLNVHLRIKNKTMIQFIGGMLDDGLLNSGIYDTLNLSPDQLRSHWTKVPSSIKKHALLNDLTL
jgi:hypothetical protein